MDSRDNFKSEMGDSAPEMSSLEWVELQNTIDQWHGQKETFLQKAKRRTMENPIAPIGMYTRSITYYFH